MGGNMIQRYHGFNKLSTGDYVLYTDHLARVQELEKEVEILQIKNRSSLANNLCPDHRDKQVGKGCLACEVEHLTATNAKLMEEIERLREVLKKCIALDTDPYFEISQLAEDALKETDNE
jgi:predicted Ser/Thr protein kinase